MTDSTIGLYVPRNSPVHRAPAGLKLLLMLVAIVSVMLLRQWWQLLIATGVVVLLYAVARIGPRIAWSQLRPLRYFVPVVAALQWWLAGWQMAVWVCGTIVLAVAIAALVTLSTRVSAMLDAMVRAFAPLRWFRVDVERIALLLAVTIRCIPMVAGIVTTVSEARKARGLGFSLVSLGAPVVIRSLRTADALGDALIARGVDD